MLHTLGMKTERNVRTINVNTLDGHLSTLQGLLLLLLLRSDYSTLLRLDSIIRRIRSR